MDFNGRNRGSEGKQKRIAKFFRRTPGQQEIRADGKDAGLADAARINFMGVVGGGFAKLQQRHQVGARAEAELKVGVLEAKSFEIGARIVRDELLNAKIAQTLDHLFDAGVVSANSEARKKQSPDPVS